LERPAGRKRWAEWGGKEVFKLKHPQRGAQKFEEWPAEEKSLRKKRKKSKHTGIRKSERGGGGGSEKKGRPPPGVPQKKKKSVPAKKQKYAVMLSIEGRRTLSGAGLSDRSDGGGKTPSKREG